MDLKIKKIDSEIKIPEYSYVDDAGFDLYTSTEIELKPNQIFQLPTGIAVQIPTGYVGLIWDKSGLSHNHGIKTLGGVIDSGYRGEVKVGVINLSNKNYNFKKGNKVAQMIIQKKETCNIIEVVDLEDADRGNNGFGSSGE